MTVFTWILQGLLALMFVMAGVQKIAGSKMHTEAFKKWGYPQWFRTVTGIVELGAAVLLVIGFWNVTAAIIGAAILIAVGIGGVITHVRIKDTVKDTAMIGVLGLLAFVLFIILL